MNSELCRLRYAVPGVLDSSELIVLTFLRTTHTTLETSPVTAFDHDTPAETPLSRFHRSSRLDSATASYWGFFSEIAEIMLNSKESHRPGGHAPSITDYYSTAFSFNVFYNCHDYLQGWKPKEISRLKIFSLSQLSYSWTLAILSGTLLYWLSKRPSRQWDCSP